MLSCYYRSAIEEVLRRVKRAVKVAYLAEKHRFLHRLLPRIGIVSELAFV